jgi:Transposase DDE domain
MAQLIINQDATLRNYLEAFRSIFSAPQWKYFETILMGLLHCDGSKTLSGILRQVAVVVTMSGLSRFLISPAWSVAALEKVRYQQFQVQVQPRIVQAHREQKSRRARRRGRPQPTVVTGYLIMDDSTHAKRYYQLISSGLGRHFSSTERKPVKGHSLFQAVYVVEEHQHPLTPVMYCQKAVCEKNRQAFFSKVDLAVQTVETFEPLPDTQTHVLVDSWYLNKRLWKAVRKRHWDLTGGLKCNRPIRLEDSQGIVTWPTVSEYAATLDTEDFQAVLWPNQEGGQIVYAHLLRTRVKKLGACQVLIIREKQNDPNSSTRFFATTRLKDTLAQVVDAAAKRWTVETLFADFKELMGSDQYQLHSAEAIRRFWALGLCLYQYLDSVRQRLQRLENRHISLGEARAWVISRHEDRQLDWICHQVKRGVRPAVIKQTLCPAFSLPNC